MAVFEHSMQHQRGHTVSSSMCQLRPAVAAQAACDVSCWAMLHQPSGCLWVAVKIGCAIAAGAPQRLAAQVICLTSRSSGSHTLACHLLPATHLMADRLLRLGDKASHALVVTSVAADPQRAAFTPRLVVGTIEW